MNPTIIPINYIEHKPNSAKYRIVGKGITVEFLSQFINDSEWTIERICENYNLIPAEAYGAWAFYNDDQEEVEQRLAKIKAEDDTHIDESQQQRSKLESQHKSDK